MEQFLLQTYGMTRRPLLRTWIRRSPWLGLALVIGVVAPVRGESVPARPDPLIIQPRHSADINGDAFAIDSAEMLQPLAMWRAGSYGLSESLPSGYIEGAGPTNGVRHSADYQDPAWSLDNEEILRSLALGRASLYRYTAAAPGGFAPYLAGADYTPPDPGSVTGAVRYVSAASTQPTPPFTNLATAAQTIQDAIDLAEDGDLILVDAGVYDTGMRTNTYGASRVVLTSGVTLASMNGPDTTIIRGETNTYVRALFVDHPLAEVHGFRLVEAAANGADAHFPARDGGGGILRAFRHVSHLVAERCSATPWGAGGGLYIRASTGRVDHVAVTGSRAYSGGGMVVFASPNLTLVGATLVSNTAVNGGGISVDNSPFLTSFLLAHNQADARGGGIVFGNSSRIAHATLLGNTAGEEGDACHFNLQNSVLINSIVAPTPGVAVSAASANNTLAYTMLHGASAPVSELSPVGGTVTWVDAALGNYRLPLASPAKDAGDPSAWLQDLRDLDDAPRILGANPDLGAYEQDSLQITPRPASYIPDSTTVVVMDLTFPEGRTPLTLGMRFTLPAGWTVLGLDGPGTPETNGETFVFTGDLTPAMTVTLTLHAAASTTGTVFFTTETRWMVDGMIDLHVADVTPSPAALLPQYPMTVLSSGSGSFSPDSGWFTLGSTVTVTATAAEGWRFVRWLGETNGATMTDNQIEVRVGDGPLDLTGEFIRLRTLNVASRYGSSSPSVGQHIYDDGSSVTVVMNDPSVTVGGTQYVCTGWSATGSLQGVGSERSVNIVMTEDAGVTWTWTRFAATHASRGYRAAGSFRATVACTVDYDPSSTVTQIWWSPDLPTGATITEIRGDGSPIQAEGLLLLRENLDAGRLTFEYDLEIPPETQGPLMVGGAAGVNQPIGP